MLPDTLNSACPSCRKPYQTGLINGIGEIQCAGCGRCYRIIVATDKEPGDWEKEEVSYNADGFRVTEWLSKPQEIQLTIRVVELSGASQFYLAPAAVK